MNKVQQFAKKYRREIVIGATACVIIGGVVYLSSKTKVTKDVVAKDISPETLIDSFLKTHDRYKDTQLVVSDIPAGLMWTLPNESAGTLEYDIAYSNVPSDYPSVYGPAKIIMDLTGKPLGIFCG